MLPVMTAGGPVPAEYMFRSYHFVIANASVRLCAFECVQKHDSSDPLARRHRGVSKFIRGSVIFPRDPDGSHRACRRRSEDHIMASSVDGRPEQRAQRHLGAALGALALAAVAALAAAAPAGAEPSSGGIPGYPEIQVPIPGGFPGFSGILRFAPPQPGPPQPQMPLGRRVDGTARAASVPPAPAVQAGRP